MQQVSSVIHWPLTALLLCLTRLLTQLHVRSPYTDRLVNSSVADPTLKPACGWCLCRQDPDAPHHGASGAGLPAGFWPLCRLGPQHPVHLRAGIHAPPSSRQPCGAYEAQPLTARPRPRKLKRHPPTLPASPSNAPPKKRKAKAAKKSKQSRCTHCWAELWHSSFRKRRQRSERIQMLSSHPRLLRTLWGR